MRETGDVVDLLNFCHLNTFRGGMEGGREGVREGGREGGGREGGREGGLGTPLWHTDQLLSNLTQCGLNIYPYVVYVTLRTFKETAGRDGVDCSSWRWYS